jgi:hypothetical protein
MCMEALMWFYRSSKAKEFPECVVLVCTVHHAERFLDNFEIHLVNDVCALKLMELIIVE